MDDNERYDAGFSQFIGNDDRPYGSFEVFHCDVPVESAGMEPGWYWWACFPGCLPDGDPCGPFPTAKAAYDNAIGD